MYCIHTSISYNSPETERFRQLLNLLSMKRCDSREGSLKVIWALRKVSADYPTVDMLEVLKYWCRKSAKFDIEWVEKNFYNCKPCIAPGFGSLFYCGRSCGANTINRLTMVNFDPVGIDRELLLK